MHTKVSTVSILLLVYYLFIASCGQNAEPPASNSVASSSTPNGEAIYKKYCIACHGAIGDMGMSGAANLQQSQLPLEARIALIRDGRNMMTPFKGILSEEEIEAVAHYTMQLSQSN